VFGPEARLIHSEPGVAELMQRFHWSLSWMSLENARATKGLRVLALDGVTPGVDTLRSGIYPLHFDVVLVSRSKPSGLAKEFIDFVGSPAGRKVIEAMGSLPIPIQ
jgi:phosphate transport system substrate-binding protein